MPEKSHQWHRGMKGIRKEGEPVRDHSLWKQFSRGAAMLAAVVMTVSIFSCAAPITHPVTLRDQGSGVGERYRGDVIALQPFADRRGVTDPHLVGNRVLGGGKKERYATIPIDVAGAVTRTVAERLERMGARIIPLEGWNFSPEALTGPPEEARHRIGGEISRLRCDAKKTLMGTTLRVEVELVFFLGDREERQVNRRPVQVQIERFEPIFKPETVERLVNEALADVMDRGLEAM
ncbi:MAG: hypothetical protein PVH30_03460 [Desulfobacterales bacterium]|jgi:hypothetical protein